MRVRIGPNPRVEDLKTFLFEYSYHNHRLFPTFREIGAYFGYSTSVVNYYIERLIEQGVVHAIQVFEGRSHRYYLDDALYSTFCKSHSSDCDWESIPETTYSISSGAF